MTLGVAEVPRSRAFYEAWGWRVRQENDDIVFFQCNGLVLALFRADLLADDQWRTREQLGVGGMTLAQNYPSVEDVDERYRAAVSAGATVLKPPEATNWGGYSGYVADPDGHVWEIAHNPYWDVSDDGSVVIPDSLP